MEKLKADREAKESKHSEEVYSTAEEIRHVLDAQEQGNDGHDFPPTPLAKGFVPPYTGADTPEASEVEPKSGVESLEDGELPPQNNSPSTQPPVSTEPRECTQSSDDNNNNYEIPFASNHEDAQKSPRKQFSETQKVFANWWPREYPYAHHEPDPTRPLTPPSPLYQTPETTQDAHQTVQISEGIKQLRDAAKAVPHPELSPTGRESMNEDSQNDEHEDLEMINRTPTPKRTQRNKKFTKIVFDRSPTKTPKKPNIQSRLGPRRPKVLNADWDREEMPPGACVIEPPPGTHRSQEGDVTCTLNVI